MENKEYEYLVTMSIARKLLKQSIITREEYDDFNTKMMEKYKPKYGDLFTDIDLI